MFNRLNIQLKLIEDLEKLKLRNENKIFEADKL